ncbi:hypothetical protein WICPIJ_000237 [Wickerhamomyces pijperi]|uniref:Ribonucleoside-diphosphate reductase n=1 Tax=Wickerhamomyces pijperi TaxID=599730 RepID=A0A9P8QD82_WICPI|nr:hypothetical protein WICPIJ_000237 [Wickerhamomyces pijperi]
MTTSTTTSPQIFRCDGTSHPFDQTKLEKTLSSLSKDLNLEFINITKIITKVQRSLPLALNTAELTELLAETLASMTTIHPDHSILAARVSVVALQRQVGSFSEQIEKMYHFHNEKVGKESPLVSEKLYQTVMQNKELLESAIIKENDLQFTYFGLKTLERSYLLRDFSNRPFETPQYLLLRVALGIHQDDIEAAIETYTLMSERYFIHASPTLFNSGTPKPYLSSCFLLGMEDDSIDGIYKTLHKSALISKAAGGLGIHVSNIRASGSYIAGSNGISNGLVPMLRVFNNTARYVDQGGNKRPGAFAIYLEPWHADVLEFLNLRKNHGKEELRARDLFYALWIPDLFMKKVKANEEWYLFSPDQAPGLNEAYGDEFESLYNKYVTEKKYLRSINAQRLWYAVLESQIETGGPFLLYKDACNRKSNQKNLGVIKSSNLCCEIVQYSSPEEVAVCNLGSVALPSFVKYSEDGKSVWFDFKKLHSIVAVLTKNLNKVIDVCEYPLPEARYSNMKNRPIAIGVQGLSDLFMELKLPFDSEEAKKLNVQIFETIYHSAIETSIELAKKQGPYASFQGSPTSQGLLQFDLWNHKPSPLYQDWDALKTRMSKYGIRNSLLVAPMPTASTSQILGFNESIEPLTSNVYSRRTLSGEFQLINRYLVEDLISLNLWSEELKDEIVKQDGSIQNIPNIPKELKNIYKTVWELSQRTLIELAADRSPFIDQSQSLNLYLKEPTMGKLTSMHFYAWSRGLKTGMYYLRTQAASAAIKFTIDESRLPTPILGTLPVGLIKKRKYLSPQQDDVASIDKSMPFSDEDSTFDEGETTLVELNEPVPKRAKIDSIILGTENTNQPQFLKSLEVENGKLVESDIMNYDIHSNSPQSCNIEDREHCMSCSG